MKLTAAGVFCLALVLLSLLMTYPLVTDIAHTVPGPPGDNFEYVYKLWSFKHSVLDLNRSPFFIPEVFYPFGYQVALSETTLSNIVLGLPLTAALGEVAAYNLLLVWSFVLSGLGACLFARYLTRSMVAGILAGVVFAFLPYRLSHLGAGHLPLLGTGWLPLLLLYEERAIRNRRARDAALAGLFYGLFALSSWYYAYIGALVALLYAALRARPWRSFVTDARAWRSALISVCIGGVVVLPALAPLLSLLVRGDMIRSTFSLQYVDQWSASLMDFVLPSIMHPLWGENLVSVYPQNVHENLLWLGAVPLALAIYGFVRQRTSHVAALAAVGLVALVLALGTTLHWAGEPVYLRVPQGVETLFSRLMYALSGKYALNPASYGSMQRVGYVVPLPTLALYLFLPFFNAMRVWARFGLVVGLVVSLLAGAGAQAVASWPRWSKRSRAVVVAILVAGVLFDFATVPYPFGVSAIGPQPVDEWLRAQPGDFAILELPTSKTWHGPALYASIQHGKQIAYGYGTYMPQAYAAWQRQLTNFPDDASLDAIKQAGIRYIVVGLRSYGNDEQTMRQRLSVATRLRLVYAGDERPVLSGDRLISIVQSQAIVPPTEVIGSVRYAYLVDRIAVYELAD